MHIGIVCHPTMGGSGLLATQLGVRLAGRGHSVDVITHETPFLLRYGRTQNVRMQFVDWPEYALFRYPPYTSALANKICFLHNSDAFDVIHVHYAIPHALAAYISKQICGVPYVVTLHGSDVHTLGVDPSLQKVTSFALSEADAVTSISNFLISIAEKEMEIKNIIKIPNFVDCELYKPDSERNISNDFKKNDELVITHSSNFRPVKRTLDLVKAFARVKKEIQSVKLLLVGDGPERAKAWRLAQKLEIDQSVQVLGVRQDIPDILSQTDVYVLTSGMEGNPLSILEAMSSGVPVVATDVGGVPEIIKDGKEGFLAPKGDIEQISEKIITLLKDQKLRSEFGKAARERTCHEFSPDKVIPQYERVYEQIIK
jgi:N-acetyl-alpha-D-glucosaminyl L-malate synthase BshA